MIVQKVLAVHLSWMSFGAFWPLPHPDKLPQLQETIAIGYADRRAQLALRAPLHLERGPRLDGEGTMRGTRRGCAVASASPHAPFTLRLYTQSTPTTISIRHKYN